MQPLVWSGRWRPVGLVNIQMAIRGTDLFVLEANPRASRTVPFVSKAIGIPVTRLAAKVLVGKPLRKLLQPYWPFPVRPGLSNCDCSLEEILNVTHVAPTPWLKASAVKEVVLPFRSFPGANVLLGPEMRSTGEVMGFGNTFPEAFAKAQIAAGNPIPVEGSVLVSLADSDKREGVSLVSQLHDWGFSVFATQGTAWVLQATGIPAEVVQKVGQGRSNVVDLIAQSKVDLVVNTAFSEKHSNQRPAPPSPETAKQRGLPLLMEGQHTVGHLIRVAALEHHIPYVANLVTFRATVAAMRTPSLGATADPPP